MSQSVAGAPAPVVSAPRSGWNPIRDVAEKLHFGLERITPDSFIFAIILTFIVVLMAMLWVGATPLQVVDAWHRGFWSYLAFSMQMTILLIFGYSMAITPIGQKVLDRVTGVPKTPAAACAWVALLSSILTFFNWGLGLAAAIFLVLGTAKRVKGVHFPLLVASAYIGCMATDGLSISITEPLLVNSAGWGWAADTVKTVEGAIGIKLAPLGFNKTIFAPASLVALVVLPVIGLVLSYLMHPTREKTQELDEGAIAKLSEVAKFDDKPKGEPTLAERLDRSKVLWAMIVVLVGGAAVLWFSKNDFMKLDLNMFNFLFIFLALVLHGSVSRFVESVRRATGAAFGIILQFPFYAGIFGIMQYTGLLVAIANWFTASSSPALYPVITMISSGIVNMFIPSSGGIWLVQGPPMVMAASNLGVELNRVIQSFTIGETITNVIQPFWALPLLGATNTEMRNIMGYCVVACVFLLIAAAAIYSFLPM